MSQPFLSWSVALLVIGLMAWMVGFGFRLRMQGVNANASAEKQSNGMQRGLIVGAAILDLYLVFRAPLPVLDQLVAARPSPAPWLSLVIMCAGGLIILVSQANMGRSWRVGVPKTENHVDVLVTSGMNRYSRNPVYLGIMIFLSGAFLAAPGPLTAFAVLVSFAGLTILIKKEEAYLRRRFGAQYDDYSRRVRRWI